MNDMIDSEGKPTYSTFKAMVRAYPYWIVEGYRCEQYSEALVLAKQMHTRYNKPIVIMEKLDAVTACYEIERIA